jgi:2-keto-4-pentenoate hydratase/2-oxohepta-3-ene-1,7-dioic acid hydratase in catechol pathway
MRLATLVDPQGDAHVGAILSAERILDLTAVAPADPSFATMLSLIEAGAEGIRKAELLVSRAAPSPGELSDHVRPLADVRLRAPIPRPAKNVFCVGLNYRSHIEANARALGIRAEVGEVPVFFTKPPTAVIGPDEPIVLDERLTSKLDYEVELGVVIGSGGSWIAENDALKHVFGFTLVNDVSARDLQWRTSQMFIGKGLDSDCPIGPWIVHAGDAGDGTDFELTCHVNGEERQRESTANLIFSVPQIIAELSKGLTLEPGDIISTGTPAGCGYQVAPPRFLAPGDIVECAAAGIGRLINPVVRRRVPTGSE